MNLVPYEIDITRLQELLNAQAIIKKELKELERGCWFCTYSEKELQEYFEHGGKVYAFKDENKIVACVGLMKNHKWNHDYKRVNEILSRKYKITDDNVLILDFCFVLPNYRGQNLTKKLILFGKENFSNFKFIVSLSSNKNIYSQNIQKDLGLKPVDNIIIGCNLLRDIFIKEI